MKTPGPDHPITIAPTGRPVRVLVGDQEIARTDDALTLAEASYAPVVYLPREAADLSKLQRSSDRTHCPYKGGAAYFHIVVDDTRIENAVWSYEDPYPAVAEIRGRLAFYPDRTRIVVG
jgi:uncharacterized protein (DUF427 family)